LANEINSDRIKKKKAVFFDRDGVINFRVFKQYITCPGEFSFIDDFFALFDYLKDKDCLLIIITNQQGIGKGIMTEEELTQLHGWMQKEIYQKTGRQFDDIIYCTDLAAANSPRRKPEPGMLLEAAEKWNIDLASSWMIGDRRSDVVAGKRAGCSTILVGMGYPEKIPEADHDFKDLYSAAEYFKNNRIF